VSEDDVALFVSDSSGGDPLAELTKEVKAMNTSSQKLWIVGCRDLNGVKQWEFVGVYDSREKAEAACIDCRFFMAAAELNETAPEETTPWPEHYQPSMEWPKGYVEPKSELSQESG
jgi:hypothetical protein